MLEEREGEQKLARKDSSFATQIPPAPTPRLPAEYWFFFTSTSLPFSKWKCQLRDPQSVVRRFWGQNEVNAISSFSPRRFASFWINDNLGKYVAGFRVAQAEEKLCLLQAYYCDSWCMENSSIHFALVQCHLWTYVLFKFLSCRPSQGILSCRWGNRMIANLEIVISNQRSTQEISWKWFLVLQQAYLYLIMNHEQKLRTHQPLTALILALVVVLLLSSVPKKKT